MIDVLVVPVEFSYGRDVQPLTLRGPPTQARGGGNGLALKLVGESIRQVFGGDIGAFLDESGSGTVFGARERAGRQPSDSSIG